MRLWIFSEILESVGVERTSRDETIDQWLLTLEQELFKDLLDAIFLAHELVFEEIDKGPLVPAHSQQPHLFSRQHDAHWWRTLAFLESPASHPWLSRPARHARVPAVRLPSHKSRSGARQCLREGKPIPESTQHA